MGFIVVYNPIAFPSNVNDKRCCLPFMLLSENAIPYAAIFDEEFRKKVQKDADNKDDLG